MVVNVDVILLFCALAALINVVSIDVAADVTLPLASVNALIKLSIPLFPSCVSAVLKPLIPLVSNSAIPLAISTRRFTCVITLDMIPVSIPEIESE